MRWSIEACFRQVALVVLVVLGLLVTSWQTAARQQTPGYLGIGLRVVEEGVSIVHVVPESPAAAQDLAVGDVIRRYDGVDLAGIETTAAFHEHFSYLRPGDQVTAVVRSGEDTREVELVLGERPPLAVAERARRRQQDQLAAGFERLLALARSLGGDRPVVLRGQEAGLEIGGGPPGPAYRRLTAAERVTFEHLRSGREVLAAAEQPRGCVRVWLEILRRGQGLGIERWEAVDPGGAGCD